MKRSKVKLLEIGPLLVEWDRLVTLFPLFGRAMRSYAGRPGLPVWRRDGFYIGKLYIHWRRK